MIGLAADDAAERNDAVIGHTGKLGVVERDRRRGGDLQRAGNLDHFRLRLQRAQSVKRAFAQHRDDVGVELGRDDENARAGNGRRVQRRRVQNLPFRQLQMRANLSVGRARAIG